MPEDSELLPEYDVDFSKSMPNKFAEAAALSIVLAPDVAKVFMSREAVNKALRDVIAGTQPSAA